MHMPGLQRLHASMQQVGIARMRFPLQHHPLTFQGVFLTDASSYQLALACLAHNFVLLFEVDKNYELTAYIHDEQARSALLAALNLGRGGNAFRTGDFMRQIDAALPARAHHRDRAWPSDLAHFRRNVHEANKIYLCGWQDNNVTGKRVRKKNLAKTRAWLDEATYLWCDKHNISTCWTDDATQALTTIDRPNWTQYP